MVEDTYFNITIDNGFMEKLIEDPCHGRRKEVYTSNEVNRAVLILHIHMVCISVTIKNI
jgi:hypothetical protein